MSKVKGMLEESMIRNPELYNGHADYEFWIQCRKEELLSNCCTAPFTEPGWPDSDFCSECHEHAGIDEDE